MCGIIGAVNANGIHQDISESMMLDAMEEMSYRGPDAISTWTSKDNSTVLGHLRLSILDPRPEGTQPMHFSSEKGECAPTGNLSIVFNGEVYNFIEIKKELVNLGYAFSTTTDTEVILAAFNAWGAECVSKFNGMFSIAIFDSETKSLFLFRDRVGIKPLYYTETSSGIVFSSEIKALKKILKNTPNINSHLIKDYMNFGYIMGQDTLEEGIKRLLPGHSLTYKDGNLDLKQYWVLNRPSSPKTVSLENASNELKGLFIDSLKLRLRADVPLGVFLSGGLDSSAVVAMLHETNLLKEPLKTFSVRYDIGEYGEEYDESKFAEQIAKQFNTEHHCYTMTAQNFIDYIPKFVKTMDEPVTEAAALSLHYVSELAKDKVTVVLSGEGSDELFAGYDLYRYIKTTESLRKLLTPIGASFLSSICNKLLPDGNKIRKYAGLTALPFEDRYRGISVYDTSYHDSLFLDNFKNLKNGSGFSAAIMSNNQDLDTLSRMLDFDTRTWLVDDLLIKADRMSMGSSLELRVPFLDHNIVEFAARIPSELKINNQEGKFILKKMMEPYLPHNIIYREKKGFPTPLALMFKGPLKDYVTERLKAAHNLLIGEFFDKNKIASLCDEHFSSKADHHRILWQLLVLEEWLQQRT